MATWQVAFWRAFYAWWLAGRPEPRVWWWTRMMVESSVRVQRAMGLALLPAMKAAADALRAFGASLATIEDAGRS